jgi:hypothetical protein
MKKAEREEWASAKKAFKNHGIKGAKLNVFENGGWHSCLRHRHFAIWHEYTLVNGTPMFWCMVSQNGSGCGDMRWTSDKPKYRRTPRLALEAVMKDVRRVIKSESKFLEEMESILK